MSDHESNSGSETSSASLLNDVRETDEFDVETNSLEQEIVESVQSENSNKSDNTLRNESSAGWEDVLGSGSVLKKIIKEGKPDSRPKRLDVCKIRFTCTLEDGTVVEKKNLSVQLGDCEIIQGLDLTIGLMNLGEICELKIQPRLAYGTKGYESLVPPNATICYEVELLSFQPETDVEALSINQRKKIGNKKRECGNWWYGRGENALAVQCYRRALDYLDEVEGGVKEPLPDNGTDITDAALQDLLEDRVNVFNNMAAAQLKMGLHDVALNSLQMVLRCQPSNVKALYRKAKVYRAKNDLATSLKCLQKANEISPKNMDVQKEISVVMALIKKQKLSERELARRMFSGPKATPESMPQKKKNESNKFFLWATVGASVLVGLVGLAAYKFKL